MKTRIYLTLTMLLLITIVSRAENLQNYLCEGVQFYYSSTYKGGTQDMFSEIYKIRGTQVKNEKEYLLVRFSRAQYGSRRREYSFYADSTIPEETRLRNSPMTETVIGLREADGRLYVDKAEYMSLMGEDSYWQLVGDASLVPYEENETGELVLYDFGKQQGEVYGKVGEEVITVSDVRSVWFEDGTQRRWLTLSNGYELIEGIGCINSPGMFFFYLNPRHTYLDVGVCLGQRLPDGKWLFRQSFGVEARQQAGKSVEWLEEGKMWVHDYSDGTIESVLTYRLEGDTIQQGWVAKKLLMTLEDRVAGKLVSNVYAGSLYESEFSYETYLTYIAPGSDVPLGLYSFQQEAGEGEGDFHMIWLPSTDIVPDEETSKKQQYRYYLKKSEEVSVQGKPARKYLMCDVVLNPGSDSYEIVSPDVPFCWVERVGSSRGLLDRLDSHLPGATIKLTACYEDGKCIFTASNFLTSGETVNLNRIDRRHPDTPGEYYDLQGCRLAAPPVEGIYVRDGKKVMARPNRVRR